MPLPSRLAAGRPVRIRHGPMIGRWPNQTRGAFPARKEVISDQRSVTRTFARLRLSTPLNLLDTEGSEDVSVVTNSGFVGTSPETRPSPERILHARAAKRNGRLGLVRVRRPILRK